MCSVILSVYNEELNIEAVYTEFAGAVRIAGTSYLAELAGNGRLVFEGAQGALLETLAR